jgi:hypothetical protein
MGLGGGNGKGNGEERTSRAKPNLTAFVRGIGIATFATAALLTYHVNELRTAVYNQSLVRETVIDEVALKRADVKKTMAFPLGAAVDMVCYVAMVAGAAIAMKKEYE